MAFCNGLKSLQDAGNTAVIINVLYRFDSHPLPPDILFLSFSRPWPSRGLPVVVFQQSAEAFTALDFAIRSGWIMVGRWEKQQVVRSQF